jgi:hypothetical protein
VWQRGMATVGWERPSRSGPCLFLPTQIRDLPGHYYETLKFLVGHLKTIADHSEKNKVSGAPAWDLGKEAKDSMGTCPPPRAILSLCHPLCAGHLLSC